ncbi:hypothetical protein BH11MYX1_BH11MYX1_39190 [soil metagenome]
MIGPVTITGASFFSTHHASAADALAGRERTFTAPTFPMVTGRNRRYTSLVTQMTLEVCGALHADQAICVFATSDGEIATAEKLIEDFRDHQLVSSAAFALSVHNSPSGVYSVAAQSTQPTTTITGANAIAAGWLEAVLTACAEPDRSVLLAISDEPVPAVFRGPRETAGVAAAFLVRAGGTTRLAMTPTAEEVGTVRTLATAVDAIHRGGDLALALGRIGALSGLRLELG